MKKFLLVLMAVFLFAGNSFAEEKETGITKLSIATKVGIGFGNKWGNEINHDLLWGSVDLGWIFMDMFMGNLEGIVELLGGSQFNPNSKYFSGLSLLLQHNIVETKSGWIPFINLGGGIAITDIGPPDIAKETNQFNLQVGAGVKKIISKKTALIAEYRWFHISSAGMYKPNNGVNTQMILFGINFGF